MRPGVLFLRSSLSVAMTAILAAGGCSSDDPTDPIYSDLSGEYAYVITDAESTCTDQSLLDSIGLEGVIRITQDEAYASFCKTIAACAEFCYSNLLVEGSSLVFRRNASRTLDDCEYHGTWTVTLNRLADGNLSWRQDWAFSSGTGTCEAHAFPCTEWQTRATEKCLAPCYDDYCADGAKVAAGGSGIDTH